MLFDHCNVGEVSIEMCRASCACDECEGMRTICNPKAGSLTKSLLECLYCTAALLYVPLCAIRCVVVK